MATPNWRTINIDALDPDSAANFDFSTVRPSRDPPRSSADVVQLSTQVRQLLRAGDVEGALRGALDPRAVPYGADQAVRDTHAQTVVEVLQSIKQADMSRVVEGIYGGAAGPERVDCLVKYLYKGMAAGGSSTRGEGMRTISPQTTGFSQIQGRAGGGEGGGQAMSVLLSWHEKVVEIAGLGAVMRCMTDRRTV